MYKNAHLIGFADAPAAPPKSPCAHLGPMNRLQLCKACRGKVQVKIFKCVIHVECSIRKKADGVVGCCAGCPEYSAA